MLKLPYKLLKESGPKDIINFIRQELCDNVACYSIECGECLLSPKHHDKFKEWFLYHISKVEGLSDELDLKKEIKGLKDELEFKDSIIKYHKMYQKFTYSPTYNPYIIGV